MEPPVPYRRLKLHSIPNVVWGTTTPGEVQARDSPNGRPMDAGGVNGNSSVQITGTSGWLLRTITGRRGESLLVGPLDAVRRIVVQAGAPGVAVMKSNLRRWAWCGIAGRVGFVVASLVSARLAYGLTSAFIKSNVRNSVAKGGCDNGGPSQGGSKKIMFGSVEVELPEPIFVNPSRRGELAAHLKQYAVFKLRDLSLLHMLCGRAIAWREAHHVDESEFVKIMPAAVIDAYLVSEEEADALKMLAGDRALLTERSFGSSVKHAPYASWVDAALHGFDAIREYMVSGGAISRR